jgi:hypothetical protein
LVAVKVVAAETAPTATEPKLLEVGLRATVPAVAPVPESEAVTDPLAMFVAGTVSVPETVPVAVGEKVICSVQVALGASVDPQVLLETA